MIVEKPRLLAQCWQQDENPLFYGKQLLQHLDCNCRDFWERFQLF